MKCEFNKSLFLALTGLGFCLVVAAPNGALAETETPAHKALHACAEQNHVSLPLSATLDAATKKELRSCVRGKGINYQVHHSDKYKKELETCLAKEDVKVRPPATGQRWPAMDDTTKDKIKQCREQARGSES